MSAPTNTALEKTFTEFQPQIDKRFLTINQMPHDAWYKTVDAVFRIMQVQAYKCKYHNLNDYIQYEYKNCCSRQTFQSLYSSGKMIHILKKAGFEQSQLPSTRAMCMQLYKLRKEKKVGAVVAWKKVLENFSNNRDNVLANRIYALFDDLPTVIPAKKTKATASGSGADKPAPVVENDPAAGTPSVAAVDKAPTAVVPVAEKDRFNFFFHTIVETNVEKDAEDNVETNVEKDAEDNVEKDVETIVEKDAEEDAEDNVEKDVEETNVEKDAEDNVETNVEKDAEDNVETIVEKDAEEDAEDNVETIVEKDAEDNVEKDVEADVETIFGKDEEKEEETPEDPDHEDSGVETDHEDSGVETPDDPNDKDYGVKRKYNNNSTNSRQKRRKGKEYSPLPRIDVKVGEYEEGEVPTQEMKDAWKRWYQDFRKLPRSSQLYTTECMFYRVLVAEGVCQWAE